MMTLYRAISRLELLTKIVLLPHHKKFMPVLRQEVLDHSSNSSEDLASLDHFDESKHERLLVNEGQTKKELT